MNSEDYDKFYIVGETDGILDVCDFDALEHRQCIYKILKDSSLGFDEKINAILSRYDLDISTFDFNEVFSLLEYLDEGHREIFSNGKINHGIPDPDKFIRLLAYFIYRHCSEAVDKEEFKASLGLSIILTYLTESISCDNIEEIARVVSEEIEYSENNTDSIKELFY